MKRAIAISAPLITASVLGLFLMYENLYQRQAIASTKETPVAAVVNPEMVATGFTSPVDAAFANDGSNRLFVLEQRGKIKIVKAGKTNEVPFIDLGAKLVKINNSYDERGLLSLCFHPKFKENGRFFVYYSKPAEKEGVNHIGVLSEFKVSQNNPDVADPASEKVIMEVPQPESNHNGGGLAFDNSGMLLFGLGDGGGQGDKHGAVGNGQDNFTLLGSILRLNVDGKAPYEVPADNPMLKADALPEIFAKGFRNPWRISVDKPTGRIFAGDVGQNMFEEIDLVKPGKNYGWRVREGFECYQADKDCNPKRFEDPIDSYGHAIGQSVCNGFVYRGAKAAWKGKFIYADWNGTIFLLEEGKGAWKRTQFSNQNTTFDNYKTRINSMAMDSKGEIYLVCQEGIGTDKGSGKIYRLQ